MGAPTDGALFLLLEPSMVEPYARVHLRQADRFDVPSLAKLRVEALVEMGLLAPADGATFTPRALAELWRLYATDSAASWLLSADGEAVGCASVVFWQRLPYPGTSLHAELAGVYVAPEYRRRGYASELISEALAGARARGVRRIVLQPTEHTRALYRSFGFDDSGQLRLSP
jgi:GNAT superfamily N-acetyltransferase